MFVIIYGLLVCVIAFSVALLRPVVLALSALVCGVCVFGCLFFVTCVCVCVCLFEQMLVSL